MSEKLFADVDWKESAHPDYPNRIKEISMFLQCFASPPLDDSTLFIASNLVFVLQRVAVGRDGLAILADFNSERFSGHSAPQMIERSCAYLSKVTAQRQIALDHLAELANAVKFEQGCDEFCDLDFEIADGRERREGLPSDDFSHLKQTPAVIELRSAIRSYRTVYPVRRGGTVLSTNKRIAAAMPAKGIRQ